jgi:3,5-epimerase/4-reductase
VLPQYHGWVKKKILIMGGSGYIGSKLKAQYPDAVAPSVDIADPVAVRAVLEKERPDIVINAAGKTGRPNIDWCEDHKIETLRSNVTGPLVLLEECLKRSIYFVHIGSGCIYNGRGGRFGFTEEDPPNFTRSFYSLTKALSDQLLKPFPVLQLRIRMPMSGEANPRNLIVKLAGYKKVLDQRNSITYLPDFMRALDTLIMKRETGIFNIVNGGALSPYQIMKRYVEIVDPEHKFIRLGLKGLPTVVRADRSNCILSNQKILRMGISMLPIADALEEALQQLKASGFKVKREEANVIPPCC